MSDYKNLVEMQEHACRIFSDKPLYGTKENGAYQWTTYKEFAEKVDFARAGLASLGVSKGDKIAIISDNSLSWAVMAYATYGRCAHFTAMYESQMVEDWRYIVEDSGARVLLVASRAIFEKVQHFTSEIQSLKHIIDISSAREDLSSFKRLLETGAKSPVASQYPHTDEPMGLIYTSGTTGKPKGVVLSHGNILSNVNVFNQLLNVEGEMRSLSFLPWAHIMGQTSELHNLISVGGCAGFAEDASTILDNLREVKPTILYSVPRVFNKIYEGINRNISAKGGFIKFLYNKGLTAGLHRVRGEKNNALDKVFLLAADNLIFKKIREGFGGQLNMAISGSAALSKEIAEFMEVLGIPIFEGYGLSETSPIVSVNSPVQGRKLGTVGRAIPGVRVEIDGTKGAAENQDGEIIVHGPNVMKGYFNLPEATREVMTENGGFRTGDLGKVDEEGFLTITGRIKEKYKLENGKYVVPSPIQEKLQLSEYISQVFLFGDNRPYNIALIVPDKEILDPFLQHNDIQGSLEEQLSNSKLNQLMARELEKYSDGVKKFESPKKFLLVAEDWTVENGLLTPTLKLKRNAVFARYETQINQLYTNR